MQHIAIDLGGKESQICVRNAKGKIVKEMRHSTAKLGKFLKEQEMSRVVVETCAESFAIAAQAQEAGHEVRVVPATLVRSLGVGARRLKNDERDARVLSEVSCRIDLPTVHIKSEKARELKTLCGMRNGLVRARTKLINTIRGWLRTILVAVRSGDTDSIAQRVREALSNRAIQIPSYVNRQLIAIEALTEQIVAADKDIAEQAKANQDCKRLMTVPGVGPTTAAYFVATVDDPSRFADAHQLESYLGLTPSEKSSSERVRRGSITKASNGEMRWLLIQAAWCIWRTRPKDPLVKWAQQVAERRGRGKAIVALARRLGGILYAMWRDKTNYDPNWNCEQLRKNNRRR
jgi:transposase